MNKRLGQYFLKSQKIINNIVKLGELIPQDIVLEIGPGKGILTKSLLEAGAKVIAIEKDQNFVQYLKNKFKNYSNFKIIHGDVLKKRILAKIQSKYKKYKIIANIPYYITSRFLRIFLAETENQPELMVLMLQKEVAQRIIKQPPKMNLLALSVQVFGEPKIISYVSKTNFQPQPKVDSAIIKISNISKDFFIENKIDSGLFFNLVKSGFSQKRKLLINNLAKKLGREKNDIKISFQKCNILLKSRPENLTLENWACLIKIVG